MAFMLAPWAQHKPFETALLDETGQLDWDSLNRRTNRIIRVLRAAGIGPGDCVAIYAGNSRHTLVLMAAAHHAGVRYIPVNWHFTADELAYVLDDCGARALFTEARFAEVAKLALAQATTARPGICLDAAADGLQALDALLADQPDDSEPDDQRVGAPMFYTSGTTGRPKGVLRKTQGPPAPAETLGAFVTGLMKMVSLPEQGVTLLCGPIYHSAQWSFCFSSLLAGSRVVMTHKFDAQTTLQWIDAHQVTNVHLVPTQFLRLLRLDAAVRQGFSGRSLRIVWHGAAPCPPETKRAMIDWWGPCIHEYYGSTEGGVVTGISSAEWLQRPRSVGRVIGKVELRILRDDGSTADTDEEGTICMRNLTAVELTYHNDAAKTQAAHLAPGWFTTGDVGHLDAEGYLHLTDRKIDMIISGGVNIYPAEIEGVLSSHPAVRDVAVIGVPNEEFGEEVKAIVELVDGVVGNADLGDALRLHCRERLAGYKVPRSIEYRNGLPRTETGKLQKRLLRDAYWHGLGRRI